MGKFRPSNPFGLLNLAGAAAMVAAAMATPSMEDILNIPGHTYRRPRKTKAADPAKKAARKRQKAARAKNRKK